MRLALPVVIAICVLAAPCHAQDPGFAPTAPSAPSLGPEEQQRRLNKRIVDSAVETVRDAYSQGQYAEAVRLADEALRQVPENPTVKMYKSWAEQRIAAGDTAPPGPRIPSVLAGTTTGAAVAAPVVSAPPLVATPTPTPAPTPSVAAVEAPASPAAAADDDEGSGLAGILLAVLGVAVAAILAMLVYTKRAARKRASMAAAASDDAAVELPQPSAAPASVSSDADSEVPEEEAEVEARPKGMYIPPNPFAAFAPAPEELPTSSVATADVTAGGSREEVASAPAEPAVVPVSAPVDPLTEFAFPDDLKPQAVQPPPAPSALRVPASDAPSGFMPLDITPADPVVPPPAVPPPPQIDKSFAVSLPLSGESPTAKSDTIDMISFDDLGISLPGEAPSAAPAVPPPAKAAKAEKPDDLVPINIGMDSPAPASNAEEELSAPIRLDDLFLAPPGAASAPAADAGSATQVFSKDSSNAQPAAEPELMIILPPADETLHGQETIHLPPQELPPPPTAEAVRRLEAVQDETMGVQSHVPQAASVSPEDSSAGTDSQSDSGYYMTAGQGGASDERTERMFRDQWDRARKALDHRDWRKAVHHLSIAAAIRPDNEEVRTALKDARKQKQLQEQQS